MHQINRTNVLRITLSLNNRFIWSTGLPDLETSFYETIYEILYINSSKPDLNVTIQTDLMTTAVSVSLRIAEYIWNYGIQTYRQTEFFFRI